MPTGMPACIFNCGEVRWCCAFCRAYGKMAGCVCLPAYCSSAAWLQLVTCPPSSCIHTTCILPQGAPSSPPSLSPPRFLRLLDSIAPSRVQSTVGGSGQQGFKIAGRLKADRCLGARRRHVARLALCGAPKPPSLRLVFVCLRRL